MTTTQFQTEIEIVFADYADEETPDPTSIDATVVREGNEVTIETGDEDFNASLAGFDDDDDGSVTFRVCEIRDEVHIAPVEDDLGMRTTQTADLYPDDDALSPKHFQYGDHYADKLVSSDLADLLGQMFDDAVEEFVDDRGIKPVAECDFDIPDIELTVVEGTAPFPSSKTGQTTRGVEKLLVEPAEFPQLRGTDFEPEDVWDGVEEAAETGEPVTVATAVAHCDGSVEECSTDRISYRVTPDGDIEHQRTHTY